jgi:hypothetical protein
MMPGRTIARLGLAAAQWLLLTAALGASIVHSSPAVEGLLTPRIDGSWPFVVAFVAALLLGITIRPYPALAVFTALMLVGAAGIFSALIATPALDGTIVWTTALRNFAIDRLIVLPLVLALPAMLGAAAGSLLRGALDSRHELLAGPAQDEPAEADRVAWWDARRE